MNALLDFLRRENRRTWALFLVVAAVLAAEAGMVFFALTANLLDWDVNLHAEAICVCTCASLTALTVWLGYLRVRAWKRQSLLHFRRLHRLSDLLVVLFSPELPQHMDQLLDRIRPPKLLHNRSQTPAAAVSLLGRLQHFIRYFSAYEQAYAGTMLAASCAGPASGTGADYESRLLSMLRPLPRSSNLIPLACTSTLLLLAAGLFWGLEGLSLLLPVFYVALVWNTCRNEAQRIGLRAVLLEVFGPELSPEAAGRLDPFGRTDFTALPAELSRSVKRRAGPATRSLRA